MVISQGLQMITPEIAKELLENQATNRRLNEKTVSKYAYDMLTNNWKYNGETIKINSENQLCDGQHRLNAIIKANKAVPMYVVTGIHPESMDTIDCGNSRSISNRIEISGKDGLVRKKSVIAMCGAWHRFYGSTTFNKPTTDFSLSRYYEWFESNKETIFYMDDIGCFASSTYPAWVVRPTVNVFVLDALNAGFNRDDIYEFVTAYKYAKYPNNKNGSLVIALREEIKRNGGRCNITKRNMVDIESTYIGFVKNMNRKSTRMQGRMYYFPELKGDK